MRNGRIDSLIAELLVEGTSAASFEGAGALVGPVRPGWLGWRSVHNGYAVPARRMIPSVVLVAAAQGAPTLGSLPHERPRDGPGPGRGGRSAKRAREAGPVG